ncbi:plasmid stabilization system protein [Rhizobium leguminosarum bv. trifolii WSM2297]|uniref:Plasmid stabilization system protein n=1 Tax=Rhizobium leguminosarum bv. trifolii WSM2297 TaxID=754762 RepID=J0KSP1_RHILT|nr:type II toxin-antitoxin system RelE/ParE family toxin [Rhizobium leguminosarum]EJC80594.1 plasmid stabilization system protein [Rhizobium leguminosarum bv. trifolii WSM2297]
MANHILSPRAEEDLRDIWRSIAPDNEQAADALLVRILEKVELAAEHPHIGSPRPELSPTARILIEGRYIAIYEPMPYGIFVVAVIYGARDVENWLS